LGSRGSFDKVCFDKKAPLAERLEEARATGRAAILKFWKDLTNKAKVGSLAGVYVKSGSSFSLIWIWIACLFWVVSLITKLEQQCKEEKLEVKNEDIEKAVANDGTLPGGNGSTDIFKKLMGNPEILTLLQSTKMQEALKLIMSGGQGDLEAALKNDP
jgi:hypothetical protein